MSTKQTWMSADQFAAVLDTYADLRAWYLPPEARRLGAFNDPNTSRHNQDLILEIAAFRSAAKLLRNFDEVPISLPDWLYDEWPKRIEDIKHGNYKGESADED